MQIDNPFEDKSDKKNTFSTFRGVFRPTFLTIIGVMIFLRQGWIVGNAGLIGGILIILMAYAITGLTALSVSSIATNVRIRSGGIFSIVSQSLGLEMGGAIGIPLYLAQGLSGALYIHGFAEGWLLFFPEHNLNYVLGGFWAVAFLLCLISTNFVFKIQSITFIFVLIAILALFANPAYNNVSLDNMQLWGNFQDGNIWYLFAVFFPAATGILVGVSMSGNLKNSRYSIPIGTLSAWGITLLIYIFSAFSYSIKDSSSILISNATLGISGESIIARIASFGLLFSCFSATLSSFASAPQVLQALGRYGILNSKLGLQKVNSKGDSNRALFLTAFIVLVTIFLGNLNDIAQLLTIFFILTYFIINIVLLIEKKVNMISFRPELSLPLICPLLGSFFCLIAILVISPVFGLVALCFVLFLYFYLSTKKLEAPWETVNSGLFLGIANWATKRLHRYSQESVRAWRPDILIPTYEVNELKSSSNLLKGLLSNRGSASVLGFDMNSTEAYELKTFCKELQTKQLFAIYTIIEVPSFYYGLKNCLSFNKLVALKSNLIFSNIKYRSDNDIQTVFDMARKFLIGVLFYSPSPEPQHDVNVINLWIHDQSPDWKLSLDSTNLDCQILLAYILQESWGGRVRLITVVKDENCRNIAREYLTLLIRFARISKKAEVVVEIDNFNDYILRAPYAKLNLFGLGDSVSKDFMEGLTKKLHTPCLFIKESGKESALA